MSDDNSHTNIDNQLDPSKELSLSLGGKCPSNRNPSDGECPESHPFLFSSDQTLLKDDCCYKTQSPPQYLRTPVIWVIEKKDKTQKPFSSEFQKKVEEKYQEWKRAGKGEQNRFFNYKLRNQLRKIDFGKKAWIKESTDEAGAIVTETLPLLRIKRGDVRSKTLRKPLSMSIQPIEVEGDVTINDKDVTINDKDVTINDKDVTINDKDVTINDKDVTIDDKDVTINDKDVTIDDKDVTIDDKDVTIDDKDVTIDDKVEEEEITFGDELIASSLIKLDDMVESIEEQEEKRNIELNKSLIKLKQTVEDIEEGHDEKDEKEEKDEKDKVISDPR